MALIGINYDDDNDERLMSTSQRSVASRKHSSGEKDGELGNDCVEHNLRGSIWESLYLLGGSRLCLDRPGAEDGAGDIPTWIIII